MDITINRRFNEKELPDMKSIRNEVRKRASQISIGTTLFMKENGVSSEIEYKKRMMKAGRIMKHSVIGWNDWDVTEEGIRKVWEGLHEHGSTIDRLGICLDWIMGVPEKYRDRFQASGSIIFKDPDEWKKIGQVVPAHPHLGDHMIGSLNSVENVTLGLSAGATSIGNLAQYYTYEYPGMEMEDYRTVDYITAMGIMGEFKEEGTCMHCNLDDGYGAQFHDVANLLGWAKMEKYVAEELMGGRMSHCYGNLFSDSMLRVVFNRGLAKIDPYGTPGTFVNGNTIDYGFVMPRNYGNLCSYALADICNQMVNPTGYAVAPVPFTEAIRIPSPEEIVEGHLTIDMMIEKAKYYKDYFDWDRIDHEADELVKGAEIFFDNLMNGLDDLGVDTEHAGEIVAVLKAMGPEQIEILYGAGEKDPAAMRGRQIIHPTSIVKTINDVRDETLARMELQEGQPLPLEGINLVTGSTDVHEFGLAVVNSVAKKAGATVFSLGTSVAIDEIADAVVETGAKVVLMSTYNGMAYSFGRDLRKALDEAGLEDVRIMMGGRLNEPLDGSDVPVDVTERLRELGVNADNDIDQMVFTIRAYNGLS